MRAWTNCSHTSRYQNYDRLDCTRLLGGRAGNLRGNTGLPDPGGRSLYPLFQAVCGGISPDHRHAGLCRTALSRWTVRAVANRAERSCCERYRVGGSQIRHLLRYSRSVVLCPGLRRGAGVVAGRIPGAVSVWRGGDDGHDRRGASAHAVCGY